MKALITGGAGFVGSHLAEALVRKGHRVRVLDDFSSGRHENHRHLQGDLTVLEGDCADPRAAARAVKGVEVVFHEAAQPSVARSVAEPLASHRANATGTLTLTFSYYMAHLNNSSSADFLRVSIVGTTTSQVFQEVGAANTDAAVWATSPSISLNSFAGQTIRIRIEAADASTASLVEAAIDDVRITQQ